MDLPNKQACLKAGNANCSFETMGRTYVEAGACGIPVIGARVGGVPSVVEDGKNGLFVNDPELVGKITHLLDDPGLRSRMAAEGVRLANERFSWRRVGGVRGGPC